MKRRRAQRRAATNYNTRVAARIVSIAGDAQFSQPDKCGVMLIPSHLFDRYENFKPNLKILRERVNRHDERFTVRGKQKGEVISIRRLMNVA